MVTELRHLPIPATAQNAYGEATFYHGLIQNVGDELSALFARDTQIEAELNAQDRQMLTKRRAVDIRGLIAHVQDQGDLVALKSQIDSQIAAAEAAWTPLFVGGNSTQSRFLTFVADAVAGCQGNPDPSCVTVATRERCIPATHLAYAGWFNAINDALEKSQQWQRIYSRRVSALAAHFKNPLEYELALHVITFHGDHLFEAMANQAALLAAALEFATDGDTNTPLCINSPDPPAYTPPPPVKPSAADPCAGDMKDFNLVASFGPVKVKASCEQFSAEVSGEGWISPFGQIGYNIREGTLTVVAGAKGQVGLGPVSADFKSGVYVKVGNDGFRDVGWRIGPNYKVSSGPAEFRSSDTMDLTFVGALGSTVL
jgi:hypothetical protein